MLFRIKLMLLGSLLCLSSIDVFSQNDILSNSRFSAVLLRDSLVLNPNEYIFNSLTLINHSSEILDLGLRIELPKGFSLLSPLASYTRIGPGQTNGIPIRIRADQNVLGGKSYIIKVTIEDPITGDKIPRIIIAELNLKTDWRASLVNPVSYTSDKESLPDFKILLANNGNRTELFDFSLESEIRLSLPSKGNQVLLRPGQDTLINVSVRSRNLEQINAEVKVIIQARNGQKILYQKLYIVSSEYKAHSFNRYYAPIEIGWQGVNLAKGISASQLFSAFGNLQLDNKKDISIRTQINLIDGEYDKFNSYFLGRLSTRFAEYEVGNIDDFMYSQINGIGSRVTVRKNNQSYQAFALKSQFHEGNISGLRQHLILSDQSKIETEALFKQNKETGLSSFFAAHSYNLNFSTNGKFTVKAGYSIEKANSIGNLEKGSLAGYSFYLSNNRAVIYSNVQYFSKWFPGLNRGMFTQNHDFKVNVGLLKIGGYGTYLNRSPQVYSLDYSESYQASSNKSTSYGFQIGVKLGNNSLLFKGGNTYQYQGSSFYLNNSEGFVNPVIKGTKLSLNYYFSNSKANHYVSLNAINSKVDKEVVSDGYIESYNIQMNGRMKSFSYSMRYDIGPSYYFDYLYLYRTGISSSRKQMSIFWHAKDKKMLQNRLSLNYIDMSAFSTKSLMLRNNIDIHNSEKGWRFGLNSSVNLLKIKAVPFISFSVSKVLNMPVPFLKRYNNLNVRMFKDANNNDKWDKGEEPIKEASILINGKYLSSDEKGKTSLRNIEKGNYIVDFSPISNQKGWMPLTILSDTVNLKRDREILIPFKTTQSIVGKVEFSAGAYSIRGNMKLAGLRIVAVSETMKEFEAITNEAGEFFFNLVQGSYTIKMPESILGDKFKFDYLSQDVLVDDQPQESLLFILKEKGRKLNIRRN